MADNYKTELAKAASIMLRSWSSWTDQAGLGSVPIGNDGASLVCLLSVLCRKYGMPTDDVGDRERETAHWMAQWASFGYPVFSITSSLEAALLMTDCSEVVGRDLVWPFDAVLVELPCPSSLSVIRSDNIMCGRYIIAHRTSRICNCGGHDNKSNDLLCELADDGHVDHSSPDEKLIGYFRESLQIKAQANDLLSTVHEHSFSSLRLDNGIGTSKGSVTFHTGCRLPEGDDILEPFLSIKRCPCCTSNMPESEIRVCEATSRLVANLFIYIAGLDPMPSRPYPVCLPTDTTKKASVPPILLGTEVKLPREMRDAAKAYVEGERSAEHRAQWDLHSRHSVRGHWRNQACGPRFSQHKRVWIRPFWKGPQDAATISRTYQTRLKEECAAKQSDLRNKS